MTNNINSENNINKNRILKAFRDYVITIAVALTVSFVVCQFVRPVKVVGQSMKQTLNDGDFLLLNKIAYKKEAPKYKDIVVIEAGSNFDVKYIIKRVVGVPGDKIDIVGSEVRVNGEILDEEYINKDEVPYGDYDIHLTLSDEEIFVMGDNRNHSSDSRSQRVGAINYKEKVMGKILFRFLPFDKIPEY